MSNATIFSVTGTKGKTTVTSILAQVLQKMTDKNVLHVTTLGHYVNGEQRSTHQDSLDMWELHATVCPGRFLYETKDWKDGGYAVLEAALGSSSLKGMGYRRHDIGVFLNVFNDHIGDSKRIMSQEDIVKAKRFVFTCTRPEGVIVFNADDPKVTEAAELIKRTVTKVSFGFNPYSASDMHVTCVDTKIILQKDGEEQEICDVTAVPWTFNGSFKPSIYNLMAVVAAILGHTTGEVWDGLADALASTRLDPYGGRLTMLRSETGATILADYAHEEESLKSVAELARTQCGPNGKVIGVLRLSYSRTDEHIQGTAKGIVNSYDEFVIFDKIDGFHNKENEVGNTWLEQRAGKAAQVLSEALASNTNAPVHMKVREDEAIQKAAELAGPEDVVVHIVGDDVSRSINWIKEYFSADFV